jgi:hypothetical protein
MITSSRYLLLWSGGLYARRLEFTRTGGHKARSTEKSGIARGLTEIAQIALFRLHP